jgi:hypothetical protein
MTLRETTRTLGLTKVGNAYTLDVPHVGKVWIKRATPTAARKAMVRLDRGWKTIAVGRTLTEVVEGVNQYAALAAALEATE